MPDASRVTLEPKCPGGPRLLDQALESMSLCVIHRRVQQPEVAALLREY